MELDRTMIKILASDTKVHILKALTAKRKTLSELSKELQLAPSSILEHTKALEKAGLIAKVQTGHTWMYYELTRKGRDITGPNTTASIILLISIGMFMVAASTLGMLNAIAGAPPDNQPMPGGNATQNIGPHAGPPDTIVFFIVLAAGLVVLSYGFTRLRLQLQRINNSGTGNQCTPAGRRRPG